MKKLSEIIRKPKPKRKFSIIEMDSNPSRIKIAKKCSAISKNIDVTLANFCTFAEKSSAICDVFDLRKDFEVKKILFRINTVECDISADVKTGTITVAANSLIGNDAVTENNIIEYCSAKNEPLFAGAFKYREEGSVQYCLTLSCAERPLTCAELEWSSNAVYERMYACIEDLYDIAKGHVPRSVLRRSTYKAEEFIPITRCLNSKTQQNIKRAEAMIKSFSENLPHEYTGIRKIKGTSERGELLCTSVCIEEKNYEETVYIHDRMLTVVCTSNLDNDKGLINGKFRLCLKENCSRKIYEMKFDDSGKLCICAHLPLCSFVPAEEEFRKFLVQLHNYASRFYQKYEILNYRVDDFQDDDILLCGDDTDSSENYNIFFRSDATEDGVDFSSIFDVKVEEGEKSYAHPPVLTDDVPDNLPF